MQQYADIYFNAKSLYMFRVSTAPIIRSTKNCNRSLRLQFIISVRLLPSNVASTPDDGCGGHPKHVE